MLINDLAKDQALASLIANGSRVDICSAEPTTYAQATSTLSLGNETGLTLGAAQDGAIDGRRTIIPAITDGDVTADGTASYWALNDGAGVLAATGPLTANQGVTNGNKFTLDAISITIRDPA